MSQFLVRIKTIRDLFIGLPVGHMCRHMFCLHFNVQLQYKQLNTPQQFKLFLVGMFFFIITGLFKKMFINQSIIICLVTLSTCYNLQNVIKLKIASHVINVINTNDNR